MAELSLDHFFNVVCRDLDDSEYNRSLLRMAITHYVTTSYALPRLHRAAQAWQPITPIHCKYRRLMLMEGLQPLTDAQLTPPVIALAKTLHDWLHTNWYLRGEVSRPGKLAAWEIPKKPLSPQKPSSLREQRILLARKRAMNVEKRRPLHG